MDSNDLATPGHAAAPSFTVRLSSGAAELPRMTALVEDAWARVGPRFECAPGDLVWRMFPFAAFDPTRDLALCEGADGALLGFAWWFAKGEVDLIVHPSHTNDATVSALIAWAEARHAAEKFHDDRALTTWSLESNTALADALTRLGYARGEDCYIHRWRALDDALPVARVPEGYVLRSVADVSEAPLRAEVHRRAFQSTKVSDASYRRVMEARGYDADLDVVAVAPDGSFAAFVLAWLDARNRVGEFEPVGTAPDHQRKGLGHAVCAEALRRLRARGATAAIVYAWHDTLASNALYESLGFREVARNRAFRRPR